MAGFFYYLQYIGCNWEDKKKGLINVHFKVDSTETHSEKVSVQLNRNNRRFTCTDQELFRCPERNQMILENRHYQFVILKKINEWLAVI
jgi:hypothetical protein